MQQDYQVHCVRQHEVPYRGPLTISKLLAANRFGWVDPRISDEHFPRRETEFELVTSVVVSYGRCMDCARVLADFRWLGIRPSNVAELLGLTASVDFWRGSALPLVALSQTRNGADSDRHFVRVDARNDSTTVRLATLAQINLEVCSFAAILF